MKQKIIKIWEQQGYDLDQIIPQLDLYQSFLANENEKMNLTAITDINAVYEKHFYDSQLIMNYYQIKNLHILDIGSGAGFPGIVLKIFEPTLKLTIIEANGKRITFLENLITKLNLKNITLIHARAEDQAAKHEEKYDAVISRAVSKLPILLELTVKFAKINHHIIALKGSNSQQEVTEAKQAIAKLNLKLSKEIKEQLPIEKSHRTLLIFTKITKTPTNYPRHYSQILKQPL